MIYKLILQGNVGGFSGRRWTFSPPAILGRDPGSAVCIEHRSISRQHCRFSLNGEGSLMVRDLNSMNGIYVDDRRVQQSILRPGQIIQIGAIQLKIEVSTEDEQEYEPLPERQSIGNVDATQPMFILRPESSSSPPIT